MSAQKSHTVKTLEIHSRTELLGDVRAFVTGAAREFGFADDAVGQIELAVDEACTNIIKHAYRFSPDRIIRVAVSTQSSKSTRKFIIDIYDNGSTFDSTSYHVPDMQEYFKQLRRGGLGIILMRKLMDEVEYGTQPGRINSLRLIKHLPALGRRTS